MILVFALPLIDLIARLLTLMVRINEKDTAL
jgi:hypothetical protein